MCNSLSIKPKYMETKLKNHVNSEISALFIK